MYFLFLSRSGLLALLVLHKSLVSPFQCKNYAFSSLGANTSGSMSFSAISMYITSFVDFFLLYNPGYYVLFKGALYCILWNYSITQWYGDSNLDYTRNQLLVLQRTTCWVPNNTIQEELSCYWGV